MARKDSEMTADSDAYRDAADLYLSLVSPETAQTADLEDPVISKWIADNAPDNAKILDAGCGLGFETIVLHKGLLGKIVGKRFRAYACDFSEAMLDAAISNGAKAGLDQSRYRRASFAELVNMEDSWRGFNVVLVNYGIYTFPDDVSIENYDAYFRQCCIGLASVLECGGHLIFNVRDWGKFANVGKSEQDYEAKHGATDYRCHYSWAFNDNGHHVATIAMSSSDGKKETISINYAQRTPEQLIELARESGLTPVFRGHHGEGATGYHVIAMRKIV
jgi:SAM-dependent methyltransferase